MPQATTQALPPDPEEERLRALAGGGQPTSGPVGSGGNVNGASAPLSQPGPNESQPAGPDSDSKRDLLTDQGSPQDKIDKMAPGEMEEAIEKSAAHVAGMEMDKEGALSDPDLEDARIKAKKRAVGEGMAGVNPETALMKESERRLKLYKQMEKDGEITPVQHEKLRDKWKNIFNIIPKEDMGLVLMDFGFRAMMAGETMGSAGAIGAAGAGALAGVQSRQTADYDRSVEQFNMADEGARGALEEARQSPDTITGEKGFMEWKDGKWTYIKDEEGNNIVPSTLGGRPSVKKWEIDEWIKAGYSENDARLAALSGVTMQQARDTAIKNYMRSLDSLGYVMIPGKGNVKERELTEADKRKYIDGHIKDQGYGQDGGGALSGRADSNANALITDKPDNWSESQWKTYQDVTGNN
jgi:hypothetical protein